MVIVKKKYLFMAFLTIISIYIFKFHNFFGMAFLILYLYFLFLNQIIKVISRAGSGGKKVHGRNFDYLILGSTTLWKYSNKNLVENKGIIIFSFYKRCLYSCFLILKHTFSYLSQNGEVLITIDCNDIDNCVSRKLYFSDLQLLHPTTLKKFGLSHRRLQMKLSLPVIFYPIYSLKMLYSRMVSSKIIKSVKKEIDVQQKRYIVLMLLEMIEFCNNRHLRPRVIFFNCKEVLKHIVEIKDEIQSNHQKLNIHLVNEVHELTTLI